jgi:hypothetical protein
MQIKSHLCETRPQKNPLFHKVQNKARVSTADLGSGVTHTCIHVRTHFNLYFMKKVGRAGVRTPDLLVIGGGY